MHLYLMASESPISKDVTLENGAFASSILSQDEVNEKMFDVHVERLADTLKGHLQNIGKL